MSNNEFWQMILAGVCAGLLFIVSWKFFLGFFLVLLFSMIAEVRTAVSDLAKKDKA